MTDTADNPLLAYGALPKFDAIEPEHVVPAVRRVLEEQERALTALEVSALPAWEGLVEPLARIGDHLGFVWGVVQHLMGVRNSDALRAAHDEVQAEVVSFSLRQGQSRPIFDALEALRKSSADWQALSAPKRRVVESLLRDARHSGVALEGAARERFNEIAQELAELATRFSNHLLDATSAYELWLRDPNELEGLPQSLLELAAQSARDGGEPDATWEAGPWRFTLDYPSLFPFLEHGACRQRREELYRAYVTRASSGELDNTPLIDRILALRREQAELLGYASYAELSLSSKMAPGVEAVEELQERLRQASIEAARSDLAALSEFAASRDAAEAGDLKQWDIAYWAERLREHRYAYSEEELRPYFPFPRVLEGLFALAERLFDVRIEAADGEATIWHPDVRFFRVFDDAGKPIAAFFLDAYSRPGQKRGGAWMDECVGRASATEVPEWGEFSDGVRLPVAYLVCNQTPPVGDKPSLMSFDEVRTLFHEFGHGLQHMLTSVGTSLAAGIRNVEWDAVELPSQFMENWCYHKATLRSISGHVDTGESLPDSLYEKLEAARTYRAGSDMLRQLYFGTTDLELHHRYRVGSGESPFDLQRRIAEKNTVLAPLPEDRFLCAFSHIFAGGYAAGYYSYKWAEVLSSDAFSAFEEAGLEDEAGLRKVGRRFKETVLGLGGSRDPMEVFRDFRGREPSPDALLRHSGLT